MSNIRGLFNLNFVFVLAASWIAGCASGDKNKPDEDDSTIRVHLETQTHEDGRSSQIAVYRSDPVMLQIDRTAFLDEGMVDQATIVEDWAGYHIQVKLTRRGSWLLESVTAQYVGRRMVIQCQWEDIRWVAAPMITKRISDGVLRFVPDASREESDRIVDGLNNVADRRKKQENPKWLKNKFDEDTL
jgi:hypothetical protein